MNKRKYYKKHRFIINGVEQEIGRHRKWLAYKYYNNKTKRVVLPRENW